MTTVSPDPVRVESELRAGTLVCPSCNAAALGPRGGCENVWSVEGAWGSGCVPGGDKSCAREDGVAREDVVVVRFARAERFAAGLLTTELVRASARVMSLRSSTWRRCSSLF